ncbi:uncharacterized protein [Montipora foliosa]|uniref:uncharacterized protein n=1 Tax=Montipora foliosa TaxID=591990 RepID=UPI0035F12615
MSSYNLSFFEKLILSRGLNFALPQKVEAREVKESFEQLYWRIEPKLANSDTKDLTSTTLKSIALNYIKHKNATPQKAPLRAVNRLKKREDIVVTRPDKGSGVVILNKDMYVALLKKVSIDDNTKFVPVSVEQPKKRGRPTKHYHPLLEKEKQLHKLVKDTLPPEVAKSVIAKGSSLAHLYGLLKTHKPPLSMCPILSAVGTYNYNLAKWLDEKLKPLSINNHTISNIFQFSDELVDLKLDENDILVSYDVTSLFTNVPVDETIELLTGS